MNLSSLRGGALGALLLMILGGCGDDSSTVTDTGPSGDTGTDTAGEDAGDSGPVDNGVMGDEIYDGECDSLTCLGTTVNSACACVGTPSETLNQVGCSQLEAPAGVTRNLQDDNCDETEADGAPELACNMAGSYRTPGEPMMVTMYGVVDVFGNGGDADEIEVEVCLEGADSMPVDCLPVVTATIEAPCSETEVQYENDTEAGERELGFYVVPNVPTETPLIVHTSGDGRFWRDIYTYNVFIPNEEVVDGGPACDSEGSVTGNAWEYRSRILADSDWTSIPLTAGLIEGIRPENGVVAGEVHDCADIRMEYALVATNPQAEVFTYFNDNPDNPLPQIGRDVGTSLLGLFAALDVAEGPVDISAVGQVGGQTVSLGWYRARVFPGAITSVTLYGLRSHQVPAD